MRFDHEHASFDARRTGSETGAPEAGALPPEIAFFRQGEIDRKVLVEAARTAYRARLCAASVLIADGHVSASRYYRALARHLDLDFIEGWPEIVEETDVASAHMRGCITLAGSWCRLIAPRGEELHRLFSDEYLRPKRSEAAITTPAHLAAILHYHSQTAIEWAARDRLPEEQPHLSVRGAIDRRSALLAAFAILLLCIGILYASRVVAILGGFLFLFGISFRLVVAARGSSHPARRHGG